MAVFGHSGKGWPGIASGKGQASPRWHALRKDFVVQ
jgi:hypothetical protein